MAGAVLSASPRAGERAGMSRAWMPLYWGDYLADTSHLTALQHGCYLLLIAHYWQHGGIPHDLRQLQRITKCPNNHWRETWGILEPFFSVQRNNFGSLERKHKRMIAGTKAGWANRGKTNQERNFKAAFAEQRDDQSQSPKILSYLKPRANRKKGTTEEER